MEIKRSEIYYVYLDPAFGHEAGGYKMRPVLVLSINDLNRKTVVTVAPGTSADNKPSHYENVVLVSPSKMNGLTSETIFQCHQLRDRPWAICGYGKGPIGAPRYDEGGEGS